MYPTRHPIILKFAVTCAIAVIGSSGRTHTSQCTYESVHTSIRVPKWLSASSQCAYESAHTGIRVYELPSGKVAFSQSPPPEAGDMCDKTQFEFEEFKKKCERQYDTLKDLCAKQNTRVKAVEADLTEVQKVLAERTKKLSDAQIQLQDAMLQSGLNIQRLKASTDKQIHSQDDFYVQGHLELKKKISEVSTELQNEISKVSHSKLGPKHADLVFKRIEICLLYTSPSPRDRTRSRMPSSA